MTKKLLLIIFIFSCVQISFAQFGGFLNKAKSKVSNNSSGSGNSSNSDNNSSGSQSNKNSSSGSNSTGTSSGSSGTFGSDDYPGRYEIEMLNDNLLQISTYLKQGKEDDITTEFSDANRYIEKIKQKKPDYDLTKKQAELDGYLAEYNKRKEAEHISSEATFIFSNISDCSKQWGRHYPEYGYAQYKAAKEAYSKDPNALPMYTNLIPECDEFYKSKIEDHIKTDYLNDFKDHFANEVKKEKDDPSDAKANYKIDTSRLNKYLFWLPPTASIVPELTRDRDSALAHLAWADNYISSGAFDKYQNSKATAEIADRDFPKVFSSNPTWETGARNAATHDNASNADFKILKTGVTTTQWTIVKNDYDLPQYRAQIVTVGYKAGGKCYIKNYEVKQQYTGHGTFNSGYTYSGFGYEREEIKCDKLAK